MIEKLKNLLKLEKKLNCNNLILITFDYEDDVIEEDIKVKVIPLWKWCLL
ncbi:protein of unknown function [Methanocaldococcus lauensis]|nr:protein of unknown function [Methanocaldococcus lauensis]